MPGSVLEQSGAFDAEFYASGSGACKAIVNPNVYVDGKGIIQPCCWAIDVSNLGDLNVENFSQTFINRLRFKSALDMNRSNLHTCSDCTQECDLRL